MNYKKTNLATMVAMHSILSSSALEALGEVVETDDELREDISNLATNEVLRHVMLEGDESDV